MTNRDDCQDVITCTRRGRGLVSRPGSTCLTPATPGLFRHPGASRDPDMALKPPTWVPAFAGTTGVASPAVGRGLEGGSAERRRGRVERALGAAGEFVPAFLGPVGGKGGKCLCPLLPPRVAPRAKRGAHPPSPPSQTSSQRSPGSRPVARLRVWVANGRRRWIATSLAADRASARQGYARPPRRLLARRPISGW